MAMIERERGRPWVLWLIFVVAVFATGDAPADPAPRVVDPSIGKVEVTLDLPKDKPFVGEMILLRMRSFIRADIVLDEVIQPALTNFDWQQLGRDKPIEAMVNGFDVSGIERDIAIFPQQPGRLIIDPFVRRVTIVRDDMQRVQADFASKPVFVDVQSDAAVNPSGAWWLPAKSLTLTDTWSTSPDEIKQGTLSRRTITLEAVGLTADRLPPVPNMSAPGTIAFKGPAKRETIITEDGPVARATYVWDIRPVSVSPAQLPAISVSWFDTTERRLREAAVPETWVAFVGTLVHPSHERAKTFAEIWLAPRPIAAGLAAFAWASTCAAFVLTRRPTRQGREVRRRLDDLVRRGRFEDEAGVYTALATLARIAPIHFKRVSRMPLVASRLAAFDAARYGRMGGVMPSLGPLAADVARLWRDLEMGEADDGVKALPPLDGALERKPTATRRRYG